MTGQQVQVRVPATSANLGPGFDCFGLALALYDSYEVEIGGTSVTVSSSGHAATELPTDDKHLVARSFTYGMKLWGAPVLGATFACTNRIPQGRGLGSSSAAIVGGLALAAQLCAIDGALPVVTDAQLLAAANQIEGHPDNVAPAILGGLTIAWIDESDQASARKLEISPHITPVVFIPRSTSPTHVARAALPQTVSLRDAAFNASRAALLVYALTEQPQDLFAATQDRLHQEQRRQTYPQAMELLDSLRAGGVPAAISGAGPSVIAFASAEHRSIIDRIESEEFSTQAMDVGEGVLATRKDS